MQMQLFRPLNVQQVNRWLQENPHIQIRGFSIAAGAEAEGEGQPLSLCAILYDPPAAPAGVTAVAAAEADDLLREVIDAATPAPAVPRPAALSEDEGTDKQDGLRG